MKMTTIILAFALTASVVCGSCSEDGPVTNPRQDVPVTIEKETGFARGADVSWLTQMESGGWQKVADDCIANINHLKQKYNKPVMICEIGMPYDQGEVCKQLITKMMATDVEGIFYWEPQAPNGYNDGYNLGCFDNSAPTVALDAFKNK